MSWDPLYVAGAITAGAGALGALGWAGRTLWRIGKGVGDLRDDFLGEPARKGVSARPGVLERMATQDNELAEIKRELTVNGGGSLKDAVTQMSGRLGSVEATLATLVATSQQPVIVNTGPVSMPPPATPPQEPR